MWSLHTPRRKTKNSDQELPKHTFPKEPHQFGVHKNETEGKGHSPKATENNTVKGRNRGIK